MKGIKEKRSILFIMILGLLVLTGCQKTPEKSAVVSKTEGLSKDVIAEPLKDGETRRIDIPKCWDVKEKKSNGRMTISAELDMKQLEVGNLPVLEMKNHVMAQDELEKLVEYFANGEKIYMPQADTKEMYQKVKERIENKEGAYSNTVLIQNFQEQANALANAIELAPDTFSEDKIIEIKFVKKEEDAALDAAESWWRKYREAENSNKNNADIFFCADIGESKESHIEAECYHSEFSNSSRFIWEAGADIISLPFIQESIRMNDSDTLPKQYRDDFQNILNQFAKTLEQQPFTQEEGQAKAEKLFGELGLPEMSLLTCDKVLWFPKGAIPKATYANSDDLLWQADLKEAEAGYEYTFTRSVGGLSVQQTDGIVTEQSTNTYTPPFPVETVVITVMEDGIKFFSWEGMSEEVTTIVENTVLLPFETIQEKLFDQIFYQYTAIGQPVEDTTKFDYKLISARLGYTNITAFKEPEHAWLVPTWFFEVKQGVGMSIETIKDREVLSFMINALDGGVIG